MSDLWYVRTKSRDRGPYDSEKLRKLAAEGKVQPEMLVSRDGKQTWIEASRIKGLEFGTRIPAAKSKSKKRKKPAAEEIDTGFDPRYGGAPARRARDVVDAYGSRLQATGERAMARLYYCGIFAGGAAALMYALVRLAGRLGILSFDTVEKSLAQRIGLPIAAAVIAGGIAWWQTRHWSGAPPEIDPDMDDDEIAEALRRQ